MKGVRNDVISVEDDRWNFEIWNFFFLFITFPFSADSKQVNPISVISYHIIFHKQNTGNILWAIFPSRGLRRPHPLSRLMASLKVGGMSKRWTAWGRRSRDLRSLLQATRARWARVGGSKQQERGSNEGASQRQPLTWSRRNLGGTWGTARRRYLQGK